MARHTANSLKGKIWLATSGLAFFVCAFGISSYWLIDYFSDNSIDKVVVRFLLIALAILIFGWWLSNEVITPIEKVSLLAKSLERGVSVSLPKTSGSVETDELLQTLHRNNQQLHNLVSLMDKVANGKLDVALTPLQNSDRLSSAFQKLLVKVTESIQAKEDLQKLEAAVGKIKEEILSIATGDFDVEISSSSGATREISEAFRYLINRLKELIVHTRNDSEQAQISAVEAGKLIHTIIGSGENRVRELNQAHLKLKQIPQTVQKISDELSTSAASADQSIEKARNGSLTAQENLNAVGELRRQMQEAVQRIGRLDERSREIGKVAKTVDDLAQRTNMIALNASIQSGVLGEQGRGFAVFAEEVERLAERAANTNKQISALNKSITVEISEIGKSLQESVGELANLSKFALETSNSLNELEKYIGRFMNLQKKLAMDSSAQSADAIHAFESFVASIGETEKAVGKLKESEKRIEIVTGSMKSLYLATADFKILPDADEQIPVLVIEENMRTNEIAPAYDSDYLSDLS